MVLRVVVLFLTAQLAALGQTVFGVEPNSGQMPGEVLFFQRSGDEDLAFTRNSLRLRRGVEVVIEGAAAGARPEAVEPLPTLYQTYLGNEPGRWLTDRRQYRTVRLPGAYPGIDAAWTGTVQSFSAGLTVGREQLTFAVSAGTDWRAIQVRFRNLGDAPFEGPGGIWFTGGAMPGVFTVTLEATQGGAPLAASLQIAGKDLLTLSAPNLDRTRPAEFRLSFPNYVDGVFGLAGNLPAKSADGNRYRVTTARCETLVVRYGADGWPVWVTTVGGAGCDEGRAVMAAAGGVAVVGWTESGDLPVPADAPGSRRLAHQSPFFLWLDQETGRLRTATYGLLDRSAAVTAQQVEANGDLVAAGVTYVPAGGGMTEQAGFLLRWRPEQNRFVFGLGLPDAVQAVASDGRGTTYYATYPFGEGSTMRLRLGALSETGATLGRPVTAAIGGGDAGSRLWAMRLTAGPDLTAAVAIALRNTTYGSDAQPVGYLGRFALQDGTVNYVRAGLPGESPAVLELGASGEVRAMYERGGTRPLETTPDAAVVAPCPNTGYTARVGPTGKLLYGAFTPAGDEAQPGGRPTLACAASTAGRAPVSGVVRGEMLTLTGGNFGPTTAVYAGLGADGRFPKELAGYRVQMNGLDAPVIAVARGLVAVQVPFELGQTASVAILLTGPDAPAELLTLPLLTGTVPVTLFDTGDVANATGLPALAALNQDGSVNSQTNPARPGSVMSLFGTRLRAGLAAGVTGGLHSVSELRAASLFSAGTNCELVWLGAAPGLSTAVFQANVRLRANAPGTGVRPLPLGLAVSDSPRFLFAPPGGAVVWIKD